MLHSEARIFVMLCCCVAFHYWNVVVLLLRSILKIDFNNIENDS